MITPVFTISQDRTFIHIIIKAPYSKVSEADVFIEDEEFKFYAKPYFLRLQLPGPLVEDDRASCVYDYDNGEYKLKIPKAKPGTHFEDLELLTKLLAPPGNCEAKRPLIEVVGDSDPATEETDLEFDWYFPQNYQSEASSEAALGGGYGFANQKTGIFGKLQSDLQGIVEIKNLEQSTRETRYEERIEFENEKFNSEHYLADFFEDDEIRKISELRPPWKDKNWEDFSEREVFTLKNLPNIEYLLDKSQLQNAYVGVVDILFSYAYNWRSTEGDYTVESPWNLRTISTTLSWCDTCVNIHSAMVSSYRRALIFPLYRNFKLAKTCHKDVVNLLSKGKKAILKCLLQIHELFANNDPCYILNDLYIKDYCIWTQKANSTVVASLAQSLKGLKIKKGDLGLDIVELEEAAHIVLQEEEDGTAEQKEDVADVVQGIGELSL